MASRPAKPNTLFLPAAGLISPRVSGWRGARPRQADTVQAIYLLESDVVEIDYSEIDLVALDDADESFYVIHARPLTSAERSSLTRKRKGKGKRK